MDAASQDPDSEIVIQPLRLSRRFGVGAALVGGFLIWQGTWLSPGWHSVAVGIFAVLFGIVSAIRLPRARVVLSHDQMIVYGQLWSRTVPRESITAITPWPFVKWTDSRGRKHSTPITVLNASGSAIPDFIEHAREGLNTLHKWAAIGDTSSDDPH